LLANIAGSFSVIPLNILGADIYTRGDSVVLDTFRVCDLKSRAVSDEAQFALFESTLQKALSEPAFDFGPLLEKARRKVPPRVAIDLEFPTKIIADNKAHPAYTLIQIETPDRLGLLFDLLSVFGREGISISLSRISTEKGAGHRHVLRGRQLHPRKNHGLASHRRTAGSTETLRPSPAASCVGARARRSAIVERL
jgi:[protein-PII] uridylyltransferase